MQHHSFFPNNDLSCADKQQCTSLSPQLSLSHNRKEKNKKQGGQEFIKHAND
jgi:hypothetical protein